MNYDDFSALDVDDPQIAGALTRAYARILAWPDPPPREEYIVQLTRTQYRTAQTLLRGTGIVLEEVSYDETPVAAFIALTTSGA